MGLKACWCTPSEPEGAIAQIHCGLWRPDGLRRPHGLRRPKRWLRHPHLCFLCCPARGGELREWWHIHSCGDLMGCVLMCCGDPLGSSDPMGCGSPIGCGDVMGCNDPMDGGTPVGGGNPMGGGDPTSHDDAMDSGDLLRASKKVSALDSRPVGFTPLPAEHSDVFVPAWLAPESVMCRAHIGRALVKIQTTLADITFRARFG